MADIIQKIHSDLVTREIYFQIKQDQKTIQSFTKACRQQDRKVLEQRRQYFHTRGTTVPSDTLLYIPTWDPDRAKHPDWYAYLQTETSISQPLLPQNLKILDSRALSIVYGMIRGKSYRQIEAKYRKGNGPSKYAIQKVLDYYKIPSVQFYAECGEIDYE